MLMLERDLTRFDETDIERMLALLPDTWATRVERKKPFASRLQSAIGYTLLKTILQEHYGITSLPTLAVDEYGKPQLEDCELFFSISHCRIAVACIVEDYPVAVDVQDIITDPDERLKKRLNAQDIDNRALTVLWTQKEASAKLDGRGLRIPIGDLPLADHALETTDHGDFILTIAQRK